VIAAVCRVPDSRATWNPNRVRLQRSCNGCLHTVATAVLRVEGVQEVHDIHIWTLGTDLTALSCHVRIPDMHMEDSEKILDQVREVLAHDFKITHSTIQFERAGLPAEAGPYMPAPASRSET